MSEFRRRVVDPLVTPIAAIGFIALLVFSVSRILLAVPEEGSVVVAMLISIEILGVGAVLSATRRVKAAQRGLLLLTGLALIGGGLGGASLGVRSIEKASGELTITASGIKFDKEILELPVGEKVVLTFVNNDANIPHNVIITKGKSGDCASPLFGPCSETITGISSTTYEIPPLPAGTFTFFCSIHPIQMQGSLTVGAEPSPGATSPPAAVPLTELDVVAQSIAFDVKQVVFKAGAQITITLENRDPDFHNFAIYRGRGGEKVFGEQWFPGPATQKWTFTGPAPGTYYFQCDVHPQMNGSAIFG